jgi:transposase
VFRELRTPTLPERRRRRDRGHRILNPYHPYLLDRWNAGCHDAWRLSRELQQRGYSGSDATVARYAQRLCQAPRPRRRRLPLPRVAEPHHRPLTARQAAWLVVRQAGQRAQDDAQLRAQHADVAEAIDLAQDFAHLVRQRQPEQREAWLARAAKSAVGAWRRLAKGLRDDFDAVNAGVTLPWSNGPVEGIRLNLSHHRSMALS